MKIYRKIYELRNKERLESVEIIKDGKRIYYSYNYQILKDNKWRISVRWDNFQKKPHVDSFDENGNLQSSSSTREKSLKEVLELIDIFGKNIVSMDITKL